MTLTPQVASKVSGEATAQATAQVTAQVEAYDKAHDEAHEPMTDIEGRILTACKDASRSTPDLLLSLGYDSRTGNFKRALSHLLDIGCLTMTLPDKPRSKNQRYRLTEKGRVMLKGMKP